MSVNKKRAPVVVVLGHVDHGKTTLLDYIRKTNIAEGEAGNITQSIGAYEFEAMVRGYDNPRITFIDTPGHKAFTQLRSRGAQVADIAILIISATDSVKPQTVESIAHIKSANIPTIVVINKIDMSNAQVEKVKKDLSKHDFAVEGAGGEIPVIPISAKEGSGVNDLLEAILIVASDKNYFYDENGQLETYIIEVKKETAGMQATCIIKNGSLSVGDDIYAGEEKVRVRALISNMGKHLARVIPSQPFILLGFKKMPQVGTMLTSGSVAREKEEKIEKSDSTESFFDPIQKTKKLSVIVKAESEGSLEAVLGALSKMENIKVELGGVGSIVKSDIFLAKIAHAFVLGFGVEPQQDIVDTAKQEKVTIKTYKIIYELLDEIEEVSQILLEKSNKKKNTQGQARITAQFTIDEERIAGIKVEAGKLRVGHDIELIRGDNILMKATIQSLKQRAKNIKEIKKGEECGLIAEPALDFSVGDMIKSYSI